MGSNHSQSMGGGATATSAGATVMGKSTSGKGGGNLHNMVLGAAAGSNDYDVSGSFGRAPTAIEELVQQRLQAIAHQLEEQKIQHERNKQEELRQLEQNKRVQIAQIADDADEEIQYMKESLKHEMKAT